MAKQRMANWPAEKLAERQALVASQLQRIEDQEKAERRSARKSDLQRTLSRLNAEMQRRGANGTTGMTSH